MHLAWPFLLILTFAAWPWRRHDAARAWLMIGCCGILFLLPSLIRPDTILSPAASLADSAPWRGTGDPADGNRELRDITYQVQPWLLHLRHELQKGQMPYWNPYHYGGAPFWSNGSAAPIFPLHLLFAALPLPVGFVLIPWLRILIGGWGAWWLARQLNVSSRGALIAGIAFPLSGMLISHLLFPMANALMLVPWIFRAVERWASGEASWRPIALWGALQLLAGHPESALHTCLLTTVYLLARGVKPFWRTWCGLVGGWGLAAMIAAVQLVPLALTLFESTRWLPRDAGIRAPLDLVAGQMLRLVLPNLFGMPSRQDFWGPVIYVATAIHIGVIALLLVGAGANRVRLDRRWRGLAAVLGFAFLGAYHLPPVYDLLLPLPLIGHAPQHRLIFGVELGLALLAAAGFDRWLAGRGRGGLIAMAAVVASLLTVSWILFAESWGQHGQILEQTNWTAAWLVLAALLASLLALPDHWRKPIAWGLPLILGIDLYLAHGRINPTLPLTRLYPTTGAVTFLQEKGQQQAGRVAGEGSSLHANAGMVYRLHDVRGDESIKVARYERYYAAMSRPEPIYSLPIHDWQHSHLDELGVRWVLTGPKQQPMADGWKLVYEGADARVFERPSALPLVRFTTPSSSQPTIDTRTPGRWQISFQTTEPQTLLIAECWDAGWRATVDGRPAPVFPLDDLFLGVHLEAGQSRLELRYRPDGLVIGWWTSLLGLILLFAPVGRFASGWRKDSQSAIR